jgi:hypothetical protein
MRKLNVVAVALLGVWAVGCARIQETPLAPNMVRLDVNPPWAPVDSEATLGYAAELTLRSGYSAFRLTPIYALAFNNFGVTVVMFRAGDPGAKGAFDAARILNKHSY